jgi:predicted metal-dependent HD superfamily phosphohydrolase
MLKEIFIALCAPYTKDNNLIETCWLEIEKNYCSKGRHYHSLKHLEELFKQLAAVKSQIADWDTVIYSMYYHDIIYDVLHNDNETNSSKYAAKRLAKLGFPAEKIEQCKLQIEATKTHARSADNDTNLFLDADLAVLGKDENRYLDYTNQIRKEFSYYPDFVYNPGRKKVLKHFLDMFSIYKTDYFIDLYEAQAKINIEEELLNL